MRNGELSINPLSLDFPDSENHFQNHFRDFKKKISLHQNSFLLFQPIFETLRKIRNCFRNPEAKNFDA